MPNRIWLQAELRLDDGANHEAAIVCATALDAPHKMYVDLRVLHRPVEQVMLRAELRHDDGANHGVAIVCAMALDAPHVIDVDTQGHASPGRIEFAAG